jgi:hypothetical protein
LGIRWKSARRSTRINNPRWRTHWIIIIYFFSVLFPRIKSRPRSSSPKGQKHIIGCSIAPGGCFLSSVFCSFFFYILFEGNMFCTRR